MVPVSKIVNNLVSKLFVLFVIVLFIVGFRNAILTDKDTGAAFGALMGTLPFAKTITDIVCKILGYQYEIPVITYSSVISDFLRLAVMALIQPLIVALLSVIFLRVPEGSIEKREAYMEGMGYKMKQMLLTIITAPLIAILAAHITSAVSDYFVENFGVVVSTLLGIGAVVAVSALSTIVLVATGTALGTALLWRLVVTLLGKMATTMGISALCLCIYVSLLGGMGSQVFVEVFALIAFLIIMDCAMKGVERAIVS